MHAVCLKLFKTEVCVCLSFKCVCMCLLMVDAANALIGMHFLAGAIISILGCVQLVKKIRTKALIVHKIFGYIYVVTSFLAGLGGLGYIFIRGCVGGPAMDVGFAAYGILMIVCALLTGYYGYLRKREKHRAWAFRLFSLAVASWLFRIYYGLWIALTDNVGHHDDFQGPFDYFTMYFFFIPNLFVAEIFIRRLHKPYWSPTSTLKMTDKDVDELENDVDATKQRNTHLMPSESSKWCIASVLFLTLVVVLAGTVGFADDIWIDGIAGTLED